MIDSDPSIRGWVGTKPLVAVLVPGVVGLAVLVDEAVAVVVLVVLPLGRVAGVGSRPPVVAVTLRLGVAVAVVVHRAVARAFGVRVGVGVLVELAVGIDVGVTVAVGIDVAVVVAVGAVARGHVRPPAAPGHDALGSDLGAEVDLVDDLLTHTLLDRHGQAEGIGRDEIAGDLAALPDPLGRHEVLVDDGQGPPDVGALPEEGEVDVDVPVFRLQDQRHRARPPVLGAPVVGEEADRGTRVGVEVAVDGEDAVGVGVGRVGLVGGGAAAVGVATVGVAAAAVRVAAAVGAGVVGAAHGGVALVDAAREGEGDEDEEGGEESVHGNSVGGSMPTVVGHEMSGNVDGNS